MRHLTVAILTCGIGLGAYAGDAACQAQAAPPVAVPALPQTGNPPQAAPAAAASAAAGVPLPPGYQIGPEDVLAVLFWRDKDMTVEQVTVRPDGRITLPLLNDVQAAGLTPEQLRGNITTAAAKYMEDPSVTIVVKAINSLKVFITGQVAKPGAYPLTSPTTVMQLIAMAGGTHEFADSKNIIVMRTENGRQMAYRFNYKQVLKRVNLKQNIELKPGDTVVVP